MKLNVTLIGNWTRTINNLCIGPSHRRSSGIVAPNGTVYFAPCDVRTTSSPRNEANCPRYRFKQRKKLISSDDGIGALTRDSRQTSASILTLTSPQNVNFLHVPPIVRKRLQDCPRARPFVHSPDGDGQQHYDDPDQEHGDQHPSYHVQALVGSICNKRTTGLAGGRARRRDVNPVSGPK